MAVTDTEKDLPGGSECWVLGTWDLGTESLKLKTLAMLGLGASAEGKVLGSNPVPTAQSVTWGE